MRFAILSDIHANLEALEAVLADARAQMHPLRLPRRHRRLQRQPERMRQLIQELECPVVKGNHDEQASIENRPRGFNALAEEAIDWTREQLSAGDKEWLADSA